MGGAGGLYQLHNDGKVYRWNANCAAGSPGCPWTLLDQSSDPAVMITAGNGGSVRHSVCNNGPHVALKVRCVRVKRKATISVAEMR